MKLNSIQVLRAVAVMLVTYNHSIDIQMQFGVSWQQHTYLNKFGAIGVDIFFVISGFIISYVADKYMGVSQGLNFLKKRFIRINPIYYIASLLFLLVMTTRSLIINPANINLNKSLHSFFDTLMVVPVTETTATYLPLLMIGWTLSFEWLFYFLFFLLILFRRKYKIQLLFVTVAFLIVLGYLHKPTDLRFAFITNPILLEFLLGTLIYKIYSTRSVSIPVSFILLGVGLTIFLLMLQFGYGNVHNSFYQRDESMKRFLLWGLPSSCIVAGCIFLETKNVFAKLWNNKWLLLIGDASYSIYLVHYSAYALLRLLYRQIGFFTPADTSIFFQFIVAILFGIGFYKIIENPLLQALHHTKPITLAKQIYSLEK